MARERTFISILILIDKACSGMANERKSYQEIQPHVYSTYVIFGSANNFYSYFCSCACMVRTDPGKSWN